MIKSLNRLLEAVDEYEAAARELRRLMSDSAALDGAMSAEERAKFDGLLDGAIRTAGTLAEEARRDSES